MDCGEVAQVDREGSEVVVRLTGEIDISNAAAVRDCLEALAGWVVTVDCSRVTFMDACALGSFVAAQRRCREEGGKLVLYGLQPAQLRLMDICGLTHSFDSIVPD